MKVPRPVKEILDDYNQLRYLPTIVAMTVGSPRQRRTTGHNVSDYSHHIPVLFLSSCYSIARGDMFLHFGKYLCS